MKILKTYLCITRSFLAQLKALVLKFLILGPLLLHFHITHLAKYRLEKFLAMHLPKEKRENVHFDQYKMNATNLCSFPPFSTFTRTTGTSKLLL